VPVSRHCRATHPWTARWHSRRGRRPSATRAPGRTRQRPATAAGRSRIRCGSEAAGGPPPSLQLDGGASALEGGLGLLGLLLVDLLEHRLRCGLDQVLGLLQAQAGERAHLLDDRDLLTAGLGEDDVELGLLLLSGGLAATGRRTGRDGHRGRGGDAEALLELLEQLAQL